jgi:hypothetical protein
MAPLVPGTVGILPAGALGVSFFFHLTQRLTRLDGRVCFLERDGSASGPALRVGGALRIGTEEIHAPDLFRPGLLECAQLPEVLLVCTQPDQLLGVLGSWVKLFELRGAAALEELPVLVLASNGIYFQRVRQFLLERLEEGTLLGQLPDLWPDLMPRLVGRLMRGVTIQTGQREGSGAAAIYHPGSLGLTRLAGGDAKLRAHVATLLTELGGWFELAGDASPTRVEFDKALVNLTANLLGQLAAIGDDGAFHRLTVGDILALDHVEAVRDLVVHVVDVGRAVRAYPADESIETIIAVMEASLRQHASHVPSSLQWIESGLRRGTLEPRLTPTEAWLLEPLIRYAHAAGLEDAAHYFEALTRRLEQRLALAIAAQRSR